MLQIPLSRFQGHRHIWKSSIISSSPATARSTARFLCLAILLMGRWVHHWNFRPPAVLTSGGAFQHLQGHNQCSRLHQGGGIIRLCTIAAPLSPGKTQYQPLPLLSTLNHKEWCINEDYNSHPKSCWIFHQVLTMKKSSNLKHKCLNWLELELPVYCGVVLLYVYDIIRNIITTIDNYVYDNIQAYFKSLIYIISTNIYISYIC